MCRRPDGSEVVLGQGCYGKVYKALKGGVQASAGPYHISLVEAV